MGVNSLPNTVTWQRRGCDLNPGPSALEFSTLTTRLSSHRLKMSSLLNKSEVVYCNQKFLLWLPACLNISYSIAQHFTFGSRVPDPAAKFWGRTLLLLLGRYEPQLRHCSGSSSHNKHHVVDASTATFALKHRSHHINWTQLVLSPHAIRRELSRTFVWKAPLKCTCLELCDLVLGSVCTRSRLWR